ncbi:hypothetical protein WJX74_009374 [Apatococcus lobatus]|uniref:Protein-tyrosine-phosphatase n=1 Tax=Apatococcus lobatus TaxID=904363 RepID=A0AAW1RSV9_9CHLO
MEPGRHNRGDALTVDLFQPTPYFDANQVAPGIWVGSLPAEQSPIQEFKTRSITHVVRCGVAYIPAEHEDELTYLKLDVMDLPCSDLLSMCKDQDTNTFIETGRKAGGVLVHCQAGVSRSATVAATYLMCSQRICLQEALDIMRKARPCICPNTGFQAQLKSLAEDCNFDLAKYRGAPRPQDHFTADERVARGNEWLAKRQGAHAPEPPSAGIWKPKKINSVMPPADVLAPDPDEQPACSVLIKT